MNLGLWIVEMLSIGGSAAFTGWYLGKGRGYEEGWQVGRHVGFHDCFDGGEFVCERCAAGERTGPARDELALALLKADPEAYFRLTREARR